MIAIAVMLSASRIRSLGKITHESSQAPLRYEVRCWIPSGTFLELLMLLKASSDGVADAVIEALFNDKVSFLSPSELPTSQQRIGRMRKIILFGVVWLILGIAYEVPADVRVSFTKMTINNCDEIGVCDWRLACALGNQTKIEFFQFVEGNTNEEITIDQVLTQKEFPPVTVNCEFRNTTEE
jgi:hypothetical protein